MMMTFWQHENGIEGNKRKLNRIVQFSETFGAEGPSCFWLNFCRIRLFLTAQVPKMTSSTMAFRRRLKSHADKLVLMPSQAKALVRKLLSVDPVQRLNTTHPQGIWSDVKSDGFYARL